MGELYINLIRDYEIILITSKIERVMDSNLNYMTYKYYNDYLQYLSYNLFKRTKQFSFISEADFIEYCNENMYEQISYDEFMYILYKRDIHIKEFKLLD